MTNPTTTTPITAASEPPQASATTAAISCTETEVSVALQYEIKVEFILNIVIIYNTRYIMC